MRESRDEGDHRVSLSQAPAWERGNERITPERVAVVVDEILGTEQVVVRSLPSLLKRHPLLAGVTRTGRGEPLLLLDSEGIVERCLAQAEQRETTPAAEASATDSTVTDSTVTDSTVAGRARQVLVVDDSLSARRSLMQKLRPFGFELHEAEDGFAALNRLRAERFDMVFTDLEMPRIGGFDLLAEIRSSHGLRHLQVVIVTSREEKSVRDRAQQIGTDGFLSKSASVGALHELLEHLEKTLVHTTGQEE